MCKFSEPNNIQSGKEHQYIGTEWNMEHEITVENYKWIVTDIYSIESLDQQQRIDCCLIPNLHQTLPVQGMLLHSSLGAHVAVLTTMQATLISSAVQLVMCDSVAYLTVGSK
jgi:hypothetical protein